MVHLVDAADCRVEPRDMQGTASCFRRHMNLGPPEWYLECLIQVVGAFRIPLWGGQGADWRLQQPLMCLGCRYWNQVGDWVTSACPSCPAGNRHGCRPGACTHSTCCVKVGLQQGWSSAFDHVPYCSLPNSAMFHVSEQFPVALCPNRIHPRPRSTPLCCLSGHPHRPDPIAFPLCPSLPPPPPTHPPPATPQAKEHTLKGLSLLSLQSSCLLGTCTCF
jgi:hypothetical protein